MTSSAALAEGGFVRMPRAWLQLAISPQAKTLLMTFCGFADAKGESWHSYEELGALLNRSKASISAYVAELREHGLIDCIRQTYGNGYNYRLRIVVRGWAEICARWSEMAKAPKRAVRPSECRVQPAERKDPKGPITDKPQNNTPAAKPVWNETMEADWRRHRPDDTAPVSSCEGTPRPELLRAAIANAEALGSALDLLPPDTARRAAATALSGFAETRRLQTDPATLAGLAHRLAGLAPSRDAITAAMTALDAAWKPHWRRLPTPDQLRATVTDAVTAALPDREALARLGRARHRAWVAGWHLRRLSFSGPVPAGTRPAVPAATAALPHISAAVSAEMCCC